MTLYLLDTNIVSDLVSHPRGRVRGQINLVGGDQVSTSAIVAAEVRFGAARKGSSRLTRQVEIVLSSLPVLAWDVPADLVYGEIRAAMEAAGQPVGSNDTLIAAHALAANAILVTDNTREFERMPGLKIENWLRD